MAYHVSTTSGPAPVTHHRNRRRENRFRLLPAIAAMAISVALPVPGQAMGPSAVYEPDLGRVAVFVRGADNTSLYDKFWNGSWWEWENLGRPLGVHTIDEPSAVYIPSSHSVLVFVVGDNGRLYDWNGLSRVWEDQGMPFAFYPITLAGGPKSAVYRYPGDQAYVFVTTTNGDLVNKHWNGNAWVWEWVVQPLRFDNNRYGNPSAVYQASLDRIHVFASDTYGELVSFFWDTNRGYWNYEDPENWGSGLWLPSAVYKARAPDTIYAFVQGRGGSLVDKYWNGSAWVWDYQGTPGTGVYNPNAVYQSFLDRIVVFVQGGDGHLYDKYWDGSAWVWEDQGTPPGVHVGPPSAVYQRSLNRIIVFVGGSDGHLWDRYWNGSAWVWEDQGIPPLFELCPECRFY